MTVVLEAPLPGEFPLANRMCGGCATLWAVEQQVNPQQRDSLWLCPDCEAEQPVLQVYPGARCRHVDYRHGPGSVLLILAVDGEYVTVQRLGQPQFGGFDGRARYHRSELVAAGDIR